mmetsp:Transcript_26331/g.47244  ORF Transcript_26331/g.47244 Transcript_26331/m.47244 type:complete len:423 (+) Transcript_26331:1435-2703(+)
MVDFVALTIFGIVSVHVAKTVVAFRQLAKLREKDVPEALKAIVTQEEFDKSQQYNFDKLSFGILTDHNSIVMTVLTILLSCYFALWTFSTKAAEFLGTDNEIVISLVFFSVVTVIGKVSDIGYSLYSTFVIEERYGFNKTTIDLFIKDLLKGLAIEAIIQTIVLSGIVWIMRNAGEQFYLYIWGFLSLVLLVIYFTYHDLIAPCFNKFTELEDSNLKDKIFQLAASLNFPLKKIFVIDGSKRSSHSNAYFFGFGQNKRIVIFDTLLDKAKGISEEEITAIIAHELGHWQHMDSLKGLVLTEAKMFVIFYAFSLMFNNEAMYTSFGFSQPIPVIGLILFSNILHPIMFLLSYVIMWFSRYNEYRADAFAKAHGFGPSLASGLVKLFTGNSGNMNPDPSYSALHFSHPTMIERLAALEASDKSD